MASHHVKILSNHRHRNISMSMCQTNFSLSKDYVPVRIIGIITVRKAFGPMVKIFINTMGKLRVTAVLEIVFNSSSCITRQLLRQYHIGLGASIIKM